VSPIHGAPDCHTFVEGAAAHHDHDEVARLCAMGLHVARQIVNLHTDDLYSTEGKDSPDRTLEVATISVRFTRIGSVGYPLVGNPAFCTEVEVNLLVRLPDRWPTHAPTLTTWPAGLVQKSTMSSTVSPCRVNKALISSITSLR